MSKSKMFEEALADAKAISKVAFENAKLTLEEHFAPTIKKMVNSKLQESLEEEFEEDDDTSKDEVDETKEKKAPEEKPEEDEKDSEDEGLNLESLLRELESDEEGETEDEVDEAKKDTEEKPEEDETPGEEIDEEKQEYLRLKEKFEGKPKSKEEFPSKEVKPEEDDSDVDETVDVEALLRELEGGEDDEDSDEKKVDEKFGDKEEAGKYKAKPMDEKAELEKLKSEINEINLVNSKLIYFNRLVTENAITSKSDKVTLLKQFDRCATVSEATLVYKTLSKAKKATKKAPVSSTKKALKESISFSSKSAGTSTAKKANLKEGEEIVNSDLATRWKFLANIK